MKIVVIGGTGLIGSKTVAILRQAGHEVVAGSPKSGVNSITGEGLKEAMAGAQVVIDLGNSPSFEDKAVLEFFETSGRNLLPAEAAAGRPASCRAIHRRNRPDRQRLFPRQGRPGETDQGFRHPLHRSIRSTQFMEFLSGIADSSADGNVVRLPPGLFQPIAADDVAADCRRCGARGAAKRHPRDRRPGTSAVQRNRRALSEGSRRPA